MLDQKHADRWQLDDLMAPEPANRPTLIPTEATAATQARLRVVLDDLIDLVLRLERGPRLDAPAGHRPCVEPPPGATTP